MCSALSISTSSFVVFVVVCLISDLFDFIQRVPESLSMIGFISNVLRQIVSQYFRLSWRIMNRVGSIQQYIVANAIIFVICDTSAAIENPRLPYMLSVVPSYVVQERKQIRRGV